MIELVRDLRVINVLAKSENDPWKIMDVRVLTGLVCPAARPPDDNTPEPLRAEGLKGVRVLCNAQAQSFYIMNVSQGLGCFGIK